MASPAKFGCASGSSLCAATAWATSSRLAGARGGGAGGGGAGEVDAKNTSQEEILTLAAKYV